MFVRKMLSFQLGEEIEIFFVLSRAWDREKFWIPCAESNITPSNSGSDTLLLSHRDSMVSEARSPSLNQVMAPREAQYEVHVWRSPYLLFEKKNNNKKPPSYYCKEQMTWMWMLVIIAGGEDVVRFFLSRGKGIHDFKEDQGGSVVTKII